MKKRPSHTSLILVLLGIITLVSYSNLFENGWVFDDKQYVVNTEFVRHGLTAPGIRWAFTTFYACNWHPLTWLSHMLDVQLYGMQPAGHHLTNLLLHLANVLLLFLVLSRMTGFVWRSAFVAALFAVHPLHVESVAWIAERKDVLSTFFLMLTILAYLEYVRLLTLKSYLLLLLFFGLGLMSKPMLVTLPFALLLLDYWPLGRMDERRKGGKEEGNVRRVERGPESKAQGSGFKTGPSAAGRRPSATEGGRGSRRAETSGKSANAGTRLQWTPLAEKLPMLAMSAFSAVITYLAQVHGGAVADLDKYPLGLRVSNALVSYLSYIGKMLWPTQLTLLYPFPKSIPVWHAIGAGLALLLSTLIVLVVLRKWRYFAVGWLWYLGTLLPVIGLVQVGMQAMADRYTYIPLIGLFLIAAWGIPDLFRLRTSNTEAGYIQPSTGNRQPSMLPSAVSHQRLLPRYALVAPAVIVIISLSVTTHRQVPYWRDNEAAFRHALNVTKNNYLAHDSLGIELLARGEVDEAVEQFEYALRINPEFASGHYNLGVAMMRQKRLNDALREFETAIRLKPDLASAHYNLALVLMRMNRLDDAIRSLRRTLDIYPKHFKALLNLGGVLARQGRPEEAVEVLARAVELRPRDPFAHGSLAIALFLSGKPDEARREADLCRMYGGTPSPALMEALSQGGFQTR